MGTRKVLIKKGAWFFLFNTVFVLLIASRYFKYFSATESFLTVFYISITTLSHFTALSFIEFLLFYLPVILVFPHKTFAWVWAAIIAAICSLVLLTDTFVFDLYRMHINGFVLELLFGGAGSQIFEFHTQQYILSAGAFALYFSVMLFFAYKFFNWQKVISFNKGWRIAFVIILMMSGSHFIHAWADAANYYPVTKSSRFYPLYFPATDPRLMLKLGLVDSIESRNNLMISTNPANKELNYPQHKIISDSTCKTNIIFILLDSWYYNVFDSTVMPHVYEFSKRCEVYNHHYSGSNGTRTGVFSLFYSIPGIYWYDVLSTQASPVFIDELLKNNYLVKTFPSASLASPPFDKTIFRKIKDLNIETEGPWAKERDQQLTTEWLLWNEKYNNENVKQPVFSFLFYDALHGFSHPDNSKAPFQPAWDYPKYELLNNDIDPTLFFNLYKNTAYFIDSLVGKVLSDLEAKGMLQNSWVILTGDHGQEFNDNKKNYWGHNGNYSAAQMQVPFLIYKPAGNHAEYYHWTSHYDFVPTILNELFHCTNPIDDYSIGKIITDSTNRNSLIVGSADNYAILQPDKITSIYFNGSYDITDSHLNTIKGAKLQVELMNKIMIESKSYYPK